MTERPVVVGVDASPEASKAAAVGSAIASAKGTECRLITAIPDAWGAVTFLDTPFDFAALEIQLHEASHAGIVEALAGAVPPETLQTLQSRSGRPAKVIEDFAHEVGAGLIVLGGKHHPALERLIAGGTATHLLRKLDTPLLVTGFGPPEIKRIMAAVDLSFAARPTLEHAQEFTRLFGTQLWVLHVVPPLPVADALATPFTAEDALAHATAEFEGEIWPVVELSDAEKAIRRGPVVETVVQSAEQWGIDLVVLGSHGKGWTDRLLLGSTTEKLLHRLPTHLLVIPVSRA